MKVVSISVLIGALFFCTAPSRAADPSTKIEPGFVTIRKIPKAPTTIAIGNPLIADVFIAEGNVLVITGKATGSTNLVLLDENGGEFLNANIEVGVGRQVSVRIYDGTPRSFNYLCSVSTCAPSLSVTASPENSTATSPPPANPEAAPQ